MDFRDFSDFSGFFKKFKFSNGSNFSTNQLILPILDAIKRAQLALKKNIIGHKNSTTGCISTDKNITDRFHNGHIYEISDGFSMDFRDFSDFSGFPKNSNFQIAPTFRPIN